MRKIMVSGENNNSKGVVCINVWDSQQNSLMKIKMDEWKSFAPRMQNRKRFDIFLNCQTNDFIM